MLAHLSCASLDQLDSTRAINAIFAAHRRLLQLEAEGSVVMPDNPVLALLADCLAEAGHPDFCTRTSAAPQPFVSRLLNVVSVLAQCEAFLSSLQLAPHDAEKRTAICAAARNALDEWQPEPVPFPVPVDLLGEPPQVRE